MKQLHIVNLLGGAKKPPGSPAGHKTGGKQTSFTQVLETACKETTAKPWFSIGKNKAFRIPVLIDSKGKEVSQSKETGSAQLKEEKSPTSENIVQKSSEKILQTKTKAEVSALKFKVITKTEEAVPETVGSTQTSGEQYAVVQSVQHRHAVQPDVKKKVQTAGEKQSSKPDKTDSKQEAGPERSNLLRTAKETSTDGRLVKVKSQHSISIPDADSETIQSEKELVKAEPVLHAKASLTGLKVSPDTVAPEPVNEPTVHGKTEKPSAHNESINKQSGVPQPVHSEREKLPEQKPVKADLLESDIKDSPVIQRAKVNGAAERTAARTPVGKASEVVSSGKASQSTGTAPQNRSYGENVRPSLENSVPLPGNYSMNSRSQASHKTIPEAGEVNQKDVSNSNISTAGTFKQQKSDAVVHPDQKSGQKFQNESTQKTDAGTKPKPVSRTTDSLNRYWEGKVREPAARPVNRVDDPRPVSTQEVKSPAVQISKGDEKPQTSRIAFERESSQPASDVRTADRTAERTTAGRNVAGSPVKADTSGVGVPKENPVEPVPVTGNEPKAAIKSSPTAASVKPAITERTTDIKTVGEVRQDAAEEIIPRQAKADHSGRVIRITNSDHSDQEPVIKPIADKARRLNPVTQAKAETGPAEPILSQTTPAASKKSNDRPHSLRTAQTMRPVRRFWGIRVADSSPDHTASFEVDTQKAAAKSGVKAEGSSLKSSTSQVVKGMQEHTEETLSHSKVESPRNVLRKDTEADFSGIKNPQQSVDKSTKPLETPNPRYVQSENKTFNRTIQNNTPAAESRAAHDRLDTEGSGQSEKSIDVKPPAVGLKSSIGLHGRHTGSASRAEARSPQGASDPKPSADSISRSTAELNENRSGIKTVHAESDKTAAPDRKTVFSAGSASTRSAEPKVNGAQVKTAHMEFNRIIAPDQKTDNSFAKTSGTVENTPESKKTAADVISSGGKAQTKTVNPQTEGMGSNGHKTEIPRAVYSHREQSSPALQAVKIHYEKPVQPSAVKPEIRRDTEPEVRIQSSQKAESSVDVKQTAGKVSANTPSGDVRHSLNSMKPSLFEVGSIWSDKKDSPDRSDKKGVAVKQDHPIRDSVPHRPVTSAVKQEGAGVTAKIDRTAVKPFAVETAVENTEKFSGRTRPDTATRTTYPEPQLPRSENVVTAANRIQTEAADKTGGSIPASFTAVNVTRRPMRSDSRERTVTEIRKPADAAVPEQKQPPVNSNRQKSVSVQVSLEDGGEPVKKAAPVQPSVEKPLSANQQKSAEAAAYFKSSLQESAAENVNPKTVRTEQAFADGMRSDFNTTSTQKHTEAGSLPRFTVDQIRELQALVARALESSKSGQTETKEARFDWSSKEFGRLKFHITTLEREVAVQIAANRQDVADMLERSRPVIERMIVDQGLKLDRFDVQHEARDSAYDLNGHAQEQQDAPFRHSGSASADAREQHEAAVPADTDQTRPRSVAGRREWVA